ncbi:MAG: OmpA family protein [Flavobacterium sp.]|nr:MAG: OmpA family protein [Flavobacterium sp.]
MKKFAILSLSVIFTAGTIVSGCEAAKNTNRTQRGVAIGAASGAVIGGVIGNNAGKGGKGALGAIIGGVVGGVAGGVIGNKMDKQAREIDNALPGAEVERVGEGIKLTLKENAIRFNIDKSTLTSTAEQNLTKLIPVFKEYPDTNIQIFGYTDSTGSEGHNQKLSEQRAAAVKQYLSNNGIAASRMTTQGMGESDPIATNDSADGRSENRRVEFAITANEKMVQEAQNEAKK